MKESRMRTFPSEESWIFRARVFPMKPAPPMMRTTGFVTSKSDICKEKQGGDGVVRRSQGKNDKFFVLRVLSFTNF